MTGDDVKAKAARIEREIYGGMAVAALLDRAQSRVLAEEAVRLWRASGDPRAARR